MKHLLQNLLKTLAKMKRKDSVKYVCPKCHTKEMIPRDAIDLVDALDPERCLIGPASFRCVKCGYPYMLPEDYKG